MSKVVSPLLIRSKNIPNYLNKLHIKLTKNYKDLTYTNFFKLILNFMYLLKFKILTKYRLLSNKFVYLYCSYLDFYSLTISLLFILLKRFKYDTKNVYHIITSIKNFIKFNKNFRKRIIYFINSLVRPITLNKAYKPIKGIKCIYSGCLYKNSKKRTFKYMKGKTSTTTLTSNIAYAKKTLNTNRGLVGIKLWVYK